MPVLVIVICLLAKWAYAFSTHGDLIFILAPLDLLVSLFTNTHSVYLDSTGFYIESINVVIDKSCSGINFMIITFGSLYSLIYREQSVLSIQAKNLALCVLLAYIITLAANTSRIVVLITSLHFSSTFSWIETDWYHQAIGVFIYLTVLLIACFIVHKTLQKLTAYHAQPA